MFNPHKKGGGVQQVLAMMKGGEGGGHKKCWGSFYAIASSFHPLKAGT